MPSFNHCRIYGWKLVGYPSSVLQNGVGRFVHPLKRLTLFFCKTSTNSAGVRKFIGENLIDFGSCHPATAVYTLPKRFKAPIILAEYLNGRSSSIEVSGFSYEDVKNAVYYLSNRSGFPIVAFEEMQSTQNPTIQGFWHPFYHQPTEQNLTMYPDELKGRCKSAPPLATEIVASAFSKSTTEQEERSSD